MGEFVGLDKLSALLLEDLKPEISENIDNLRGYFEPKIEDILEEIKECNKDIKNINEKMKNYLENRKKRNKEEALVNLLKSKKKNGGEKTSYEMFNEALHGKNSFLENKGRVKKLDEMAHDLRHRATRVYLIGYEILQQFREIGTGDPLVYEFYKEENGILYRTEMSSQKFAKIILDENQTLIRNISIGGGAHFNSLQFNSENLFNLITEVETRDLMEENQTYDDYKNALTKKDDSDIIKEYVNSKHSLYPKLLAYKDAYNDVRKGKEKNKGKKINMGHVVEAYDRAKAKGMEGEKDIPFKEIKKLINDSFGWDLGVSRGDTSMEIKQFNKQTNQEITIIQQRQVKYYNATLMAASTIESKLNDVKNFFKSLSPNSQNWKKEIKDFILNEYKIKAEKEIKEQSQKKIKNQVSNEIKANLTK